MLAGMAFSIMIDEVGLLPLMREAVEAIHPDAFCVTCYNWRYHLGRMVIDTVRRDAAGHRPRVVCEFYDLTSALGERAILLQNFNKTVVDFDLDNERVILMRADGVAHRYGPRLSAELDARLPGRAPELRMWPYPTPELIAAPVPKLSALHGQPHLVWAGVLISPNHGPAIFHDSAQIRLFEILVANGLYLDIYPTPFQGGNEGYIDLLRQISARHGNRLRVLGGLPPDLVTTVLARYDLGVMFSLITPEAHSMTVGQLHSVIATKIFTYLESGLPVFINAEYDFMAGFVVDNDLGLRLASTEIERAPQAIRDYLSRRDSQAVARFNEANAMPRRIGPYLDLLLGEEGRPPSVLARDAVSMGSIAT